MHSPDGSAVLVVVDGVVRYDVGAGPTALVCTAGELRRALDALGSTTAVAFAPHGVAPPSHRGVTALPVTDAVKRVAAGRVTGTVDRTQLRYVVGPAVVARNALDALLVDLSDDALVQPLTAGLLRKI